MFLETRIIIGINPIRVITILTKEIFKELSKIIFEIKKANNANTIPTP